MSRHPDVELAERIFGSFRRDPRALASLIAEDAVWTVVGRAPVAGAYEGRRAIFDLFKATQTLSGGTYKAELRYVLADDERTIAVYRASGRRGCCLSRGLRDAFVTPAAWGSAAACLRADSFASSRRATYSAHPPS